MTARMSSLVSALRYVAANYLGGKTFIVTSTDRGCAQQLAIKVSAKVGTYSSEPGASSFHLNGNAFDGVVHPYSSADQRTLGNVARFFGFRWGGDFKNADPVHFDDGHRSSPGYCPPSSRTGR